MNGRKEHGAIMKASILIPVLVVVILALTTGLSNPLPIVENKDGSRIISPLVLQTISIVLNFRADIVCQHSIDRPCGYLIRPQIWFLKMSPSIHHHLKSIGLEPQKRYTRSRGYYEDSSFSKAD